MEAGEHMGVNEKMTAIADAIRSKTGGTEPLNLDAMAQAINGFSLANANYYFEFATFDAKTASYTIQHDMGITPGYACYFMFPYELEPGESLDKPFGMRFAGGVAYRDDIYYSYLFGETFQFTKGATLCTSISDTQAVISPYGQFQAGYTYGFIFWEG